MYTAEYVARQIETLKGSGIPLDQAAWKAALLCVGWAYVFGARGEYCDPSNRRSRANAEHPTIQSACRNFKGQDSPPGACELCKWYPGGRTRFFDCRGFVYWVIKQVYGFALQGAGATTQWNTESNWKAKGEIATMPKDTLCCLFVRKGNKMEHTGFGWNDETCECSSGVQHFTKRKAKWTHWAVPACVGGEVTPQPKTNPTLRRGSKGEYVTALQTALKNQGYDLGSYGVDGDYGRATEAAVKAFQQDHGLTPDGITGAKTWEAIQQGGKAELYTVTITGLTATRADEIIARYGGTKRKE